MSKKEWFKKFGCEKISTRFCNDSQTLNSIAIWWDIRKDVAVHVDLNIWHTKESKNNYLELGLKVKGYKQIDEICIYIPYLIQKDDIQDKVSILSSDPSLTKAMFNENLTVTPKNNSFCPVQFPQASHKDFEYCILDETKDIVLEDNHLIKLIINKNSTENLDTVYYRFRINKLEKIFTEVNENYVWLDGLFKKTGFLEVNLNSVRKLPENIVDKLDGVQFDSSNLFIMTNNFTNFLFQSEKAKKSRILENHIWEQYLSKENRKDISKIIAYHWKNKKDNFEDYNLFVKLSYISKNIWSWLIMVGMILLLGAVGGIGGNYATKWVEDINISNSFSDINQKGEQNETKS